MSRFPGVKVEVVVVEELAVTVMMMRLEQVDFGQNCRKRARASAGGFGVWH